MSNARYDLGEHGAPIDRVHTKLLYVSRAKYGGDWNSLMHIHAFTELFYVVGGSGQFKFQDRLIAVETNDLILVNPNVPHTEVSLNANPLEYIVLGVSDLEFKAAQDGDGSYAITNFRDNAEEVLFYLKTMLREIENKAQGYELVCQDLLEMLLVSFIRQTQRSLAPTGTVKRLSLECSAVRRYIEGHFKEALTLDMLADMTHLNKYYMVHAFSREYGVSPINYLIQCRIRESLHLLRETNHPLSHISGLLGFSSPSYFTQSFHRIQGISPMQYRKKCRSAEKEAGKTIPSG